MERRDLYEVLGVQRGAALDEIKSAYRQLAREHHPDVNPDDAAAEERFKEIAFAKEVLLDEEKRRAYDEFGFEGLESGFDPEQGRAYREWAERAEHTRGGPSFSSPDDLEDLLSQLFGAGRQHGPSHRRGADLETELTLDFLVAVQGGEVPVRLQGSPDLRLTIPPGTSDGTRLRLGGKGMQPTPESEPGDLYVRVRVRPHPFYERDGNDLRLDLPVTVPELILGAEVSVPTPSGPVTMKIPRGSSNGQRMRLKGKGVPASGGKTGNLYARLVAVMPEATSEELDSLAQDLAAHYGETDVRDSLQRNAS